MLVTRGQWMGRDERGSIFLSGMMLVLVMTLIGSGVFTVAVMENRLARDSSRQAQAFYTAEAGINAALQELADGNGVNDFAQVCSAAGSTTLFANTPFSGGSYTVSATPVSPPNCPRVTVTSTGCIPAANPCPTSSAGTTLSAAIVLKYSLEGPFFALGTFTMTGGGLIDSFDSSAPGCQVLPLPLTCLCQKILPPFDCAAYVRTNGVGASSTTSVITLASSSMYGNLIASQGRVSLGVGDSVYGNVTYAPTIGSCVGCTPLVVHGAVIQAATPAAAVPAVPACSPYSTAKYVSDHITQGPLGSWTYDATTGVATGSGGVSITITPGTFCFASFTLSGGSTLNIANATDTVFMYATGQVALSGGVLANTTGKAQAFQVLSSFSDLSQDGITITSGSSVYVYVYAPGATIKVSGVGSVFGALLGHDITVSGGTSLHFDKALNNATNLQGGALTYQMQSWQACKNSSCS